MGDGGIGDQEDLAEEAKMGEDEKVNAKIHKTLGSLETGMDNVSKQISEVKKDVRDDLKAFGDKLDTVQKEVTELNGKTVKQDQCSKNVGGIHDAISGLREDIARKQTREGYQAVGQFTTKEIATTTKEIATTTDSTSLAVKIKNNALAISAVLSLLGILLISGYKVTKFMVKVESQLVKKNKPHIVYVKSDKKVAPDAGNK